MNFIFNNTHISTPITAIMLSQAALQADKIMATQSNTNVMAIMILCNGFNFGINKNAALSTRYMAKAAPYAVWSL